jgi:hypothetical protein
VSTWRTIVDAMRSPTRIVSLFLPLALGVGPALGCASEGSANEQGETPTSGESETDGVCEPPENATPSGETATFTIRNDRDVAIYVLPYSSFGCNYGKVEIDIGGAPVLWDHAGTYAYDCSQPNLCDWGCSDGGAMGFIINPGATAQVEWGGAYWTDAPLSESCKAEMDCINDPGDTCEVRALVDGEYTVRVNLSETCPVEDECMACTEGTCEVFFYEPGLGDTIESFETSAVFPAGLELVVN